MAAAGLAEPATPRATLTARWQHLTGHVLPGLAAAHRWPIKFDHCFMRVCLDAALEQRWDMVVERPAIRHLSDAQLARAVAIAEYIAADPALLPELNAASLRMRGKRSPLAPGAIRA